MGAVVTPALLAIAVLCYHLNVIHMIKITVPSETNGISEKHL